MRDCSTEKNSAGMMCNGEHIKGIVCDVKNCKYHDCDTHCTAKEILVGPSNAQHSGDTACVTFKPKED
jgi:hypothetical protein